MQPCRVGVARVQRCVRRDAVERLTAVGLTAVLSHAAQVNARRPARRLSVVQVSYR